jgi:CRISPR/Cas system CSM-associated protein Csm3 (group 7 of RAMP superfamily)
MNKFNNYLTLVKADIVLKAPLLVGGGEDEGLIDLEVIRDGKGRCFIPGTSLAGSLTNDAAHLIKNKTEANQKNTISKENMKYFHEITGKYDPEQNTNSSEQDDYYLSRWIVRSAYSPEEISTWYRAGVGIRQDTLTAQDGALFDLEFIPPGNKFKLHIEIDKTRNKINAQKSEELLFRVLKNWEENYGFFGYGASRGFGWIKLENIKIIHLNFKDSLLFPDSSTTWEKGFQNLKDKLKQLNAYNSDSSQQNWVRIKENLDKQNFHRNTPRYQKKIKLKINLGEDPSGYGWNSLAMGSHPIESIGLSEENQQKFVLFNNEIKDIDVLKGENKNKDFDNYLPTDGNKKIIIPSTSIRGVLRHQVSRLQRTIGKNIADPMDQLENNNDNIIDDVVNNLFGFVNSSSTGDTNSMEGKIYIKDGVAKNYDKLKLGFFMMHAEDEFTAGVFEGSLFDQVAIVEGEFESEILIFGDTTEEVEERWKILKPALDFAKFGFLPLGKSVWRGFGWPNFSYEIKEQKKNGE